MDPTTALAMTGATTIVAAMATSAWQAARAGVAGLFHRRGHALAAIEAQLDDDAAIVEQDEIDAEGARHDLIGLWKRRLIVLLREHPEAETDLQALIDEVSRQLPDSQRSWTQTNLARDGGQVFAALGGNVIVNQAPAPRSQPTPDTPLSGDNADGLR